MFSAANPRIAAFSAKRAAAHQALLPWQRITMIFAGSEGNFGFFAEFALVPQQSWTRITHY
jgi:hypothetical protein